MEHVVDVLRVLIVNLKLFAELFFQTHLELVWMIDVVVRWLILDVIAFWSWVHHMIVLLVILSQYLIVRLSLHILSWNEVLISSNRRNVLDVSLLIIIIESLHGWLDLRIDLVLLLLLLVELLILVIRVWLI